MTIEKVKLEDAAEILAIYAPYVRETAISFEYEVPSLEEFEGRIRNISSRFPYIKAVSDDGVILGYAYATAFKTRKAYDWSVESTVYVKRDARRSGIGKALYTALEKSLTDMGILNMNACIATIKDNAPAEAHLTNDSEKFHEHLGFKKVGTFHSCGYKFDRWYDMIWMEKLLGEHAKQPGAVDFGNWSI